MNCITQDVEGGCSLKMWTRGIDLEELTLGQLGKTALLPILFHHIAVMPDVHFGKGATIGSVIATEHALIPSAVGLDIGCGMQVVRTNLNVSHVTETLGEIRQAVEGAILRGHTQYGGVGYKTRDLPTFVEKAWIEGGLAARYTEICEEDPKLYNFYNARQLGTLGGGNHFIELSVDKEGFIWWMLHSGSRGPGAQIAAFFMAQAVRDTRKEKIELPDPDLAYLRESTSLFDRYVRAMLWSQDFANANRCLMMDSTLEVFRGFADFEVTERIDCHHNFASVERHFDRDVWITRKGATRARLGERGIIPGSMGTGSYIVRGKGEPQSFTSCSHGAGRALSRTAARKAITLADHIAATQGVDCCKEARVLDESPAAYKDLEAVMRAQVELVEPMHYLRPLINLKG